MNAWLKSKPEDKIARVIAKMVAATDRLSVDMRNYAGDDNEFCLWLWLCNDRIMRRLGVGLMDIEDWGWRDAYDSDLSPAEAVRDAMAELYC